MIPSARSHDSTARICAAVAPNRAANARGERNRWNAAEPGSCTAATQGPQRGGVAHARARRRRRSASSARAGVHDAATQGRGGRRPSRAGPSASPLPSPSWRRGPPGRWRAGRPRRRADPAPLVSPSSLLGARCRVPVRQRRYYPVPRVMLHPRGAPVAAPTGLVVDERCPRRSTSRGGSAAGWPTSRDEEIPPSGGVREVRVLEVHAHERRACVRFACERSAFCRIRADEARPSRYDVWRACAFWRPARSGRRRRAEQEAPEQDPVRAAARAGCPGRSGGP